MNTFTFDKKEQKLLTVEIDGKKYTFNPYTLAVKKACEKFVTCQQPLVNRMKKGQLKKEDLEDIVFKSCSLVRETINSILGKGSYERIFSGRTVDFKEHQDLMTFLFEEITAFSLSSPNTLKNEFTA